MTPVLIQDTEKIDSLTSEVESLKVCSGFSYEFFKYLVYIFKKKKNLKQCFLKLKLLDFNVSSWTCLYAGDTDYKVHQS